MPDLSPESILVNSPSQPARDSSQRADPKWRRAALSAVRRLARKRERFTSADVLIELQNSKSSTHDLRALGGVMSAARDEGVIENVGLVRRSDRYSRSATTLWQSRILNSQPEAQVYGPRANGVDAGSAERRIPLRKSEPLARP